MLGYSLINLLFTTSSCRNTHAPAILKRVLPIQILFTNRFYFPDLLPKIKRAPFFIEPVGFYDS